jgi:RNA polymerase sigma factor (sigma-70 family)
MGNYEEYPMSDEEPDHDESNEDELLQRWKEGDQDAADQIVNQYLSRLTALARTRLSPKMRRRVDPEDVVQSAYRSFFRNAADDKYVLERSGDLWRLLAAIMMNKLHGQVEYHTAKKRAIGKEESMLVAGDGSTSIVNPGAFAKQPSTTEMLGLTEELERTMAELPASQRRILELRLQGHSVEEIAEDIDRSERTVRRALENIRNMLAQRLNGEGETK